MKDEQLILARKLLAISRIKAMNLTPYYSDALVGILPVERLNSQQFSLDGRWRLYYDPEIVLNTDLEILAGKWIHLISHAIRKHPERFNDLPNENKNPKLYHLTTDAHINKDLQEMNIVLPDDAFMMEDLPLQVQKGKSVEEMYNKYVDLEESKKEKQESLENEMKAVEENSTQESKDEESQNSDNEETNQNDKDSTSQSKDNKSSENDDKDKESLQSEQSNNLEDKDPFNNNQINKDDSSTEKNNDDSNDSLEKQPKNSQEENTSDKSTDEFEQTDQEKPSKENLTEFTPDGEELGEEFNLEAESGEQGGSESQSYDSSDDESSQNGESQSTPKTNESTEDNNQQNPSQPKSSDQSTDNNQNQSSNNSQAKDAQADHLDDCGSIVDGDPRDYEEQDTEDGSLDPTSIQDLKEKTAENIIEYAKSKPGSVGRELLREAKEILEPEIDWMKVFLNDIRRDVAKHSGSQDYSFRQPSKLYQSLGLYMPSLMSPPAAELAIVLDTSGSMKENRELAQALPEMQRIIDRAGRFAESRGVKIINCDSSSKAVVSIVQNLKKFEIIGGGGTDMRVGMKAAAELKPQVDIIVVITDGGTPWTNEKPKSNRNAKYYVLLLIDKKGQKRINTIKESIPSWMKVIPLDIPRKRLR